VEKGEECKGTYWGTRSGALSAAAQPARGEIILQNKKKPNTKKTKSRRRSGLSGREKQLTHPLTTYSTFLPQRVSSGRGKKNKIANREEGGGNRGSVNKNGKLKIRGVSSQGDVNKEHVMRRGEDKKSASHQLGRLKERMGGIKGSYPRKGKRRLKADEGGLTNGPILQD